MQQSGLKAHLYNWNSLYSGGLASGALAAGLAGVACMDSVVVLTKREEIPPSIPASMPTLDNAARFSAPERMESIVIQRVSGGPFQRSLWPEIGLICVNPDLRCGALVTLCLNSSRTW